ncbi:GGDEF domain-containing protein [Galenea microaerophila]
MQLKHFFWLLPLTGFAFWQAPHLSDWPIAWQQLLHEAPIVLASLGAFVSIYLNRIQPLMLFATLLVASVGMEFLFPGHLFGHAPSLFYPIFTLWLPLVWLLWTVMPEKGIKHLPYLLLCLLLLILPALGLKWAVIELSEYWARLISLPISSETDYWLQLPKISVIVVLSIFAILLVRLSLLKRPKVLDSVTLVVYVLIIYGLNHLFQPLIFDWVLSISALLILLSLIFDAHFIAYNDQLTGLNGRRALLEDIVGLGRKYAIAMVDIDHFKKFNDTYGHDVGDLALQQVAEMLSGVKGGGHVYRYGGEEFTILYPRKTAQEAQAFLQQLCEQVAATPLRFQYKGESVEKKITISIGVADSRAAKQPESVMKCADEALYQAKQAGRNQVKVYNASSSKVTSYSKHKKQPNLKKLKKEKA